MIIIIVKQRIFSMKTLLFFIFLSTIVFAFHSKLSNLEITSPDIISNEPIATKFTLYGENISPELHISDIPNNAKSLALILEDPDAVSGTWVHYLVKNIPISKNIIKENENPGSELINSFGYSHYGGPKPPKGTGIHHYYWRVYALDEESMSANTVDDFRKEVDNHKVCEGYLMGTYEKK